MAIIFLKKVLEVMDAYDALNQDEQAEFRKLKGLWTEGEIRLGVRT